jgi:hypothetical protein
VPCTNDTPLILSFDGKGIVMRPEYLRADTRKAAEAKGGNKMKTRLAVGEKLGRKRMAMIGALYDADPAPRTVEDVIGPDDDPDRPCNPGPKAFNKWLVGSVTDNTQTVISTVFDQAEQRDPHHARPWVVLVDGAKAQIEQILTEAEIRGVDIHIVVDVIHILEYLWKATWVLPHGRRPCRRRGLGRRARPHHPRRERPPGDRRPASGGQGRERGHRQAGNHRQGLRLPGEQEPVSAL